MRKNTITALFMFYCLCLYSQHAIKLKSALKEFASDPVLRHASWGFVMKKISDKSIVAEFNSQLALIPASTLKVLTTSTALEILGEQYRFQTLLQYSGTIFNDTLLGNIYVKGSGDPTLGSDLFRNGKSISVTDRWCKQLIDAKIHFIKGSMIADVDAFDDEITPPNWLWTDMGNYYGAGSCGLNYMDNKFSIYFDSGTQIGESVSIKSISPKLDNIEIINEVQSAPAGSGDKAFIFGEAFSIRRAVRGTIPINKDSFKVEGAMPDPALYCMQVLQKKMNQHQHTDIKAVPVTSRILREKNQLEKLAAARITIDTVFSPLLKEIVYYTNLKSNNLYAESILKSLSYKINGKGVTNDAINIIKSQISKYTNTGSLSIYDGSGLSPMNRMSPDLQCDVLIHAAGQKYFNALLQSFPVAGKSGSLSNICKNTPAEGRIIAKSGYIEGVRAYTGYIKNMMGEWMAFSFIVNNYNCSPSEIKKKIEKVFIAMAEL